MTRISTALVLALALLAPLAGAREAPPEASVELGGERFTVELAQTDAERTLGLMYRREMAPDHGMLFIFEDEAPRGFWMKNTLIPLDMLFFDAGRRLLNIQQDVPPCRADPCPSYRSSGPARYVLELNGGRSRALDLAPGAELSIHRPEAAGDKERKLK